MLHGVIWDFDGTIIDTETPQFEAWQSIFLEYGVTFDIQEWAHMVGTISAVDPLDLLEKKVRIANRSSVYDEYSHRLNRRMSDVTLQSGVRQLLSELEQRMIPSAIASSSSRKWIKKYLLEHEISRYFSAIATADDVGMPKPDPAVYRLALTLLRVKPDEAVAIEDSPHGARAAKDAGIFCLIVPNPSTMELDFPEGQRTFSSLEAVDVKMLREMV